MAQPTDSLMPVQSEKVPAALDNPILRSLCFLLFEFLFFFEQEATEITERGRVRKAVWNRLRVFPVGSQKGN